MHLLLLQSIEIDLQRESKVYRVKTTLAPTPISAPVSNHAPAPADYFSIKTQPFNWTIGLVS